MLFRHICSPCSFQKNWQAIQSFSWWTRKEDKTSIINKTGLSTGFFLTMNNTGTLFLIPSVIAENTTQSVLPQEVIKTTNELDEFIVENERTCRNMQLLNDLLQTCNLYSHLCIASNLTGEDEFISTRTIKEWKNNIPELNKKTVIFLLYK